MSIDPFQDCKNAMRANDLAELERILKQAPDVVHESNSYEALAHVAARLGSVEALRILKGGGADLFLSVETSGTPLHCAALSGRVEALDYLLKVGSPLDVTPGKNALLAAVGEGSLQCCRLLLNAGFNADFTFRSETGKLKNALSYAVERGRHEIAELLRAHGCTLPVEEVSDEQAGSALREAANSKEDANPAAEIRDWMKDIYAPVDSLTLQEIVPVNADVQIAINVIRPAEDHPHLTLFTTGMSSRPLPGAAGEEPRYAELIMHLPGDWPDPADSSHSESALWPLQRLREVAYYPHLHAEWVQQPHAIVSLNEPPMPLGPGTKQTCLLLIADFDLWSPLYLSNGKAVTFYTVVPLYTEDQDFEKRHGIAALLNRLQENGFTTVIQPDRKNVGLQ